MTKALLWNSDIFSRRTIMCIFTLSMVFCFSISDSMNLTRLSVKLKSLAKEEVVSIEWDPSTEDADAVARTFVHRTGIVSPGGDRTGDNAARKMAITLRAKAMEDWDNAGGGSFPHQLSPALRLASLRRPNWDRRPSTTVISLFTGHDASIAVGQNGRIMCVLELERLLGKRYYCSPRHNSTEFVQDWMAALKSVRDLCAERCPLRFDFGVIVHDVAEGHLHHQLPWLVEEIFHVETWKYVDHHEAHARSGFFASPFRSALIVSFDGGGNDGYFNIYRGTFDRVERLARLDLNLGQMYNFIASNLFEVSGKNATCSASDVHKPLEFDLSRAGKLMSYAALGSSRTELGKDLRGLYLKSGSLYSRPSLMHNFIPSIETPTSFAEAVCMEGLQGQRDVAATAQIEFEKLVLEIIEEILKLYDDNRNSHSNDENDNRVSPLPLPDILGEGLVLTGGCALNVRANQVIRDRLAFRQVPVFVPPAPGDNGLTVGGVWAVTPPPVRPQNLQYAGFLLWDVNSLEEEAHRRGAKWLSSLGGVEYLAEILCSKARPIVAVVRGRQEYGPRALGHRSLLALPDSDNIKMRMNRLKYREFYRPVAPMIAEEHLEQVFGSVISSPYMSMAPPVLPEVLERFPGLGHLDGTTRHQSVRREDEPWIHELLHHVGNRTGLAALINTSFNTHGKPICNTIVEALAMLDSLPDLDYVLIENWLFEKKVET